MPPFMFFGTNPAAAALREQQARNEQLANRLRRQHVEQAARDANGIMDMVEVNGVWMTQEDARGRVHASDCAIYNEPAFPNGPCDCGASW